MMKHTLEIGALALAIVACSSDVTQLGQMDVDVSDVGEDAHEVLAAGNAILAPGDTGADVEAAHDYFATYGYFENDELRRVYPSWEPLIGEGPSDPAIFGEELRLAVSALQARSGLEVTGVVDAPTRAVMSAPRCGVPDSAVTLEENLTGSIQKWDDHQDFGFQSDHTLTYRISFKTTDNYGSMTQPQVTTAVQNAFATWQARTNVTFSPVASGEDILIGFINQSPLATGTPTAIFIDNRSDWGFASNRYHLESVLLHEIGHTLGFDHSSMDVPTIAVMWPTVNLGEIRNQLQVDEQKAIAASPYTTWKGVPSSASQANDIGASTVGTSEFTWRIGTGAHANGFTIARWRETTSDWTTVDGGGVRIDLAGNTPWIVTSQGLARQRSGVTTAAPNGTSWIDRGDLNFVDIGANANGVVWALGGTANSEGDYDVYRFIGGVSWVEVTGDARYIDVDSAGAPWVVTAAGNIYHRSGVNAGNPNGTSWSNYGSGARDIGAGTDSAWVTGPAPGSGIYQLRIQPGVAANCSDDPADCVVEAQNGWYRTDGAAAFITVGGESLPWAVAGNGSIWRRRR